MHRVNIRVAMKPAPRRQGGPPIEAARRRTQIPQARALDVSSTGTAATAQWLGPRLAPANTPDRAALCVWYVSFRND